jgi:hypothetical protein
LAQSRVEAALDRKAAINADREFGQTVPLQHLLVIETGQLADQTGQIPLPHDSGLPLVGLARECTGVEFSSLGVKATRR